MIVFVSELNDVRSKIQIVSNVHIHFRLEQIGCEENREVGVQNLSPRSTTKQRN